MNVCRQNTSRWPSWLGAAGVAALALVIFAACSDSARRAGFRYGDLVDYSLPRADYVGQALRQGRLPLWDVEVGGGVDTLASPLIMLFYPPNGIHAFLPARTGTGILVIAHLLLGGLAFYRWVRLLGAGPLPAMLASAGLLFVLSGMAWWPHMLFSLAWVCVLLWRIDRPGPWTRGRWAGLAAAYAMMVLAGHPQLLAYNTILLGAYVAVKAWKERKGRLVLAFGLAAAAGLAVAAIQILPTKAHLDRESWRPLGTLAADVAHYLEGGVPAEPKSSQWVRILVNTVDNSQRERWICNRFSCGYLGCLVPLAVLAALWRRPTWRTVLWLAAMAGGLYLCVGFSRGLLPVYDWIARLPVVGAFRTPDRFIFWFLLGSCVLAAGGMQRIWQDTDGGSWRVAVMAAAVVMVTVRAAIWLVGGASGGSDWLAGGRSTAGEFLLWSAGIIAVGWLVLAGHGCSAAHRRRVRIVAGGVLVAVTAVDFWQASAYVCPFFRFEPQAGIVQSTDWTRTDRVLLTADDVRKMNELTGGPSLYRWYVCSTYMPVMRDRAFPAYFSLPYYEGLPLRRHFELDRRIFNVRWPRHAMLWGIPASPHRRLMDKCSVRAIVTPEELPAEQVAGCHASTASRSDDGEACGWHPAGRLSSGAWVYLNPWAIPRVSLHAEYKVASEEESADDLLSAAPNADNRLFLNDPPSKEWRRAWVGENIQKGGGIWSGERSTAPASGPASAPSSAPASAPTTRPAGQVRVLADQGERMTLEADCTRHCLLLITDSHAPGWRCEVDGRPTPILRANYLHRAVELPPGKHVVKLRYVPAGLHAGAMISAAGVLAIAAVWASRWVRRKKVDSE